VRAGHFVREREDEFPVVLYLVGGRLALEQLDGIVQVLQGRAA